MNFIFEQIRTGGDRNFGYLIGDRKNRIAAAIDPSFHPELFLERARSQHLEIKYILNTHGHADHINGNLFLKEQTDAKIIAYKDSHIKPDIRASHKDVLTMGKISLKIFYVPGHASDHILIWLPEQNIAVTGDLLFVGKIGGTSTEKDAAEEWDSLQFILSELPDHTSIWPGHDYGCRPASTIALEKLCNPFLHCENLKEFLKLKETWTEFKTQYGLK